MSKTNTVLWWGRFDADYSRNRVLRAAFAHLGWEIIDYRPRVSALGGFGAARTCAKPDLIWVPCFRQRDVLAAAGWARRRGIPVVFDPLISAYDKQVFERELLPVNSLLAKRLLHRERRQFAAADLLVADTQAHADYFSTEFKVPAKRLHVIPVGAEEAIFRPCHRAPHASGAIFEVLFYGTFIDLQGPQVIVEAAQHCRNPNIIWTLLGAGPLLARCQEQAALLHLNNLRFEPWISYPDLPQRICQADILLGVFGTSAKAARVIPNKVYQSLACGRPVVTRKSTAYPRELSTSQPSGLYQIEPGAPAVLAAVVEQLCSAPESLPACGIAAQDSYDRFFSSRAIHATLRTLLEQLVP